MSVITTLAEKTAAQRQPEDFLQDGLLYCGRCGTAKQCRVTIGDRSMTVGCHCACAEAAYQAARQEQAHRERQLLAESLRADGIQDRGLRDCRFDAAEETPELARCRRYAARWPEMREQNLGLLLWGPPGNGKTFAAACVANHIIQRGASAMITSFPRILGAGWDKQALARQMNRYDLLVIDDLGVERGSSYALETVYLVVDERYKARLPLIITTNLTLDQLRQPGDLACQRIYDRILELCVPIAFRGPSRRRTGGQERRRAMQALLAE